MLVEVDVNHDREMIFADLPILVAEIINLFPNLCPALASVQSSQPPLAFFSQDLGRCYGVQAPS